MPPLGWSLDPRFRESPRASLGAAVAAVAARSIVRPMIRAAGGLLGAAAIAALTKRTQRSERFRELVKEARGRGVVIDDQGRIVASADPEDVGIHLRDLPAVERTERKIERQQTQCERTASTPRARRTFDRREDAARELLEQNPELHDLVQANYDWKAHEYERWRRGGRVGPKPELSPGDGRFDALNEGLDKKGKRKISSWAEALIETAPPSRHWEEMPERIEMLEDVAQIPIQEPEPLQRLEVQAADRKECAEHADQAKEDLLAWARSDRYPGRKREREDEPEDMPF